MAKETDKPFRQTTQKKNKKGTNQGQVPTKRERRERLPLRGTNNQTRTKEKPTPTMSVEPQGSCPSP